MMNRVKSAFRRPWVIAACVALAAAALVAAFIIGQALSRPSAEDIAREWVDDNLDRAGEIIAAAIGLNLPIVSALGGEFIERALRGAVAWEYSEPREADGGLTEITATASARISSPAPLPPGFIEISLPFVLTIDRKAGEVTDWRADHHNAAVESDIPDLPDLPDIPGLPSLGGELPDISDLPGGLPDLPDGLPDIPDLPNIPDLPGELPDIPDLPDLPDGLPDISDLPELPNIPELPDELPDIPDLPSIPDDLPDLPGDLTDLPDIPELPDLPGELPDLPGLGGALRRE